jgi:hypothetical protein
MSGIGAAIGPIVGAGASLFGGISGANAAGAASQQAAQAQILAAIIQQQMFNQVRDSAQPFMQYGQNALTTLAPLIGTAPGTNPLTAPYTAAFRPTMEQLQQTPGYQFALDQGLRAVQNAAAARGLGSSGNALRGAAEYATGLASQTYQQQFQNYWANNLNAFNMLSGAGGMGLNALGTLAGASGQASNAIGNSLTGAGNAIAQGTIAGTAAMNNGIYGAYGASGLSNPYSTLNSYMNNALGSMGNGLSSFFGSTSPRFSQPEMPIWWS